MSNEFWVAFFGSVSAIACAAIPLIYKYLALVESIRAQKEEAEEKAATQSSTICDLQDEACRAQALAIHAASEMVAAREESRKLYEFVTTDVFNAGVLQSMATSGRPPLEPLTDPAPLGLEPK